MENTYFKKSMRSWIIILLLIAVVAVAAIYYFFIAKNGADADQNQQQQVSNESIVDVTISSTGFSPSVVTIRKGATIVWTNKDTSIHTVTADKDGPMSPDLHTNSTYSDTFITTGTYSYHCTTHPEMKGVINVIE